MSVTAVESATLTTVGYDETQQLLELEFRSQAIYRYFGVPGAVHEALLGAPSKGRYFNRFIRGRFPYALAPQGQAGVCPAPLVSANRR